MAARARPSLNVAEAYCAVGGHQWGGEDAQQSVNVKLAVRSDDHNRVVKSSHLDDGGHGEDAQEDQPQVRLGRVVGLGGQISGQIGGLIGGQIRGQSRGQSRTSRG